MRLTFILYRIADEEEIEVTDNELEARVTELAQMRGQRPAQLHETLSREGQLESLRSQMTEDKVVAFLIEQAEVSGSAGVSGNEEKPAKQVTEEKEES